MAIWLGFNVLNGKRNGFAFSIPPQKHQEEWGYSVQPRKKPLLLLPEREPGGGVAIAIQGLAPWE